MSERTIALASEILDIRGHRAEYFNVEIFDEHSWDLMLLLYTAASAGRSMSVEEIRQRITVRAATLKRWVDILTRKKIITIDQDRVAYRLSPDAKDKMNRLLSPERAA